MANENNLRRHALITAMKLELYRAQCTLELCQMQADNEKHVYARLSAILEAEVQWEAGGGEPSGCIPTMCDAIAESRRRHAEIEALVSRSEELVRDCKRALHAYESAPEAEVYA